MKNISVKYENRQANECFKIATTSLGLAISEKDNYIINHHCVTGIIFTAFAIEAMINHYGNIFDDNWNKKKGKRKELHKLVFKHANLPNCYCGASTYQKADECFNIRDYIAHGKTTNENGNLEIEESLQSDKIIHQVLSIKPKIYKSINISNLKKYINVARIIQNDIEEKGFYPDKIYGQKRKLCERPLDVSGIYGL